MANYKLMPVVPTPEILGAGEYALKAGCYISGIYADMLAEAPIINIVATKNEQGQIVSVTLQNEDHRILQVIAEAAVQVPPRQVTQTVSDMITTGRGFMIAGKHVPPEDVYDLPPVQGEPVAAQVRYRRPEKGLPDWTPWQPAGVDKTNPAYYLDGLGWEVEYRLLYTTPQPAPDISQLIEALEICLEMEERPKIIKMARAAIANYRKQGDKS